MKKYYYIYQLEAFPELSAIATKFVSYFIYRQKKLKLYANEYIPASSLTLKALCENYTKIISELVEKEVIIVNDNYAPGAFSKSYKFTKQAQHCITNKKYTKFLYNPNSRMKHSNNSPFFHDELLSKICEYYKDISIDKQWSKKWESPDTCGDFGEYHEDETVAKSIITKNFNITYGDSNGRVYHPIICGPRRMRQFIRYKNNKLIDIDVKACHPMLLSVFCDADEKQKWIDFASRDFYEQFVTAEYSREDVKQQFQIAVSKPKYEPTKNVLAIQNKIKEIAPKMFEYLQKTWATGISTQMLLQQMESKIFLATMKKCMNKMFILPMHDGFLCLPQDADKIIETLNEICIHETGLKLKVCAKEL